MAVADSYYYNKMNKLQQRAYYSMREGLKSLAHSFPVPRLSGKELADIFFLLRLEHPDIFYAPHFSYRFYEDSEYVEMIPEYLFEKKKIKEHIQAMDARVKNLAKKAREAMEDALLVENRRNNQRGGRKNSKSAGLQAAELAAEKFIHDFICENVNYDKLKKAYSHEIIGALGHGTAVCEGIAKSVKIICDKLDIWCIIAISEANPEKGIRYRHAWNIIKIGNEYYHLDCTFDNSLGVKRTGSSESISSSEPIIRYDYFNLSDRQIKRDHQQIIWDVPKCSDDTHTYYREKKISFTKMEDVKKRCLQAAKKGKVLIFQWRGGFLTRDVQKDIVEIAQNIASNKGKHAIVSVNRPQAVVQVVFSDETPVESFIEQEANEGETCEGEASEDGTCEGETSEDVTGEGEACREGEKG